MLNNVRHIADVSIIAANYNNGRYLSDFVQSVLDSTMLPKELIIVDDGSTDESMKVLSKFEHVEFLLIISFKNNRGFTTALNTGLDSATSKYIMRADPDDILKPDRIEKQFVFLEQHPDIDLLGSNAVYFLEKPEALINRTNFPVSHNSIVKAYQNGEHGLLHATVCAKRNVFQQYRYQKKSPGEDYELFARMAKDGHAFFNLKNALYLIRVHRKSSTSTINYNDIEQTFRFRDKIYGTKTSKIKIWIYYNYIRFYRKSQLSVHLAPRLGYLALAVFFYPLKLIRRLSR